MKQAIVTGASSGIGKAIASTLLQEGYEVFGIGRTFHDAIQHPYFHPIILDLQDIHALEKWMEKEKLHNLHVLVNNAGSAYYGLHETMQMQQIEEMMHVNVTVPMILTQKYMRILKQNKGTVIFISSVSGKEHASHGAVYGASKAALLHFSNSLFDEVRKHGVKVTCIVPDMTHTDLYRNANFMADTQEDCCLYPSDIAEAVQYVLHTKYVVREIELRPQLHRLKRK